jgi:hypothetical protein
VKGVIKSGFCKNQTEKMIYGLKGIGFKRDIKE